MRRLLTLLAICEFGFSSSMTFAADLREEIGGDAGSGASFDRPLSFFRGAQINADKGASTVSIKASKVDSFITQTSTAAKPGEPLPPTHFNVWSLTAAAPLDKNGDNTQLASLDGLANTTNVEFKFTQFTLFGRIAPRYEELDKICEPVLKKINDPKRLPDKGGCGLAEVEKYSPKDADAYRRVVYDHVHRWIWGGNAKIGYKNFEYVDSSSAKKNEQKQTPWSLGVFGGYNQSDKSPYVATLGFQYQRAYKEGDQATVCPTSTSGAVTCVTDPVNAPNQVTKKILSLEGRKQLSAGGIGMTLNRDFQSKVWGLELPIHLLKDKEGKYIGGIKAGWRSDKHVWTFGVFVGSTFDVLN